MGYARRWKEPESTPSIICGSHCHGDDHASADHSLPSREIVRLALVAADSIRRFDVGMEAIRKTFARIEGLPEYQQYAALRAAVDEEMKK